MEFSKEDGTSPLTSIFNGETTTKNRIAESTSSPPTRIESTAHFHMPSEDRRTESINVHNYSRKDLHTVSEKNRKHSNEIN
jgi:hypothetical protein